MRNLAIRLVLWLCRVFDIALVDEARTINGMDAIARGQQWEAFAREEGGLFDMIDEQRRAAFEAYADCRPGDHAEKEYLAMQDRCLRQLKARIGSVIQAGVIEADSKRKAGIAVGTFNKSV